MTHNKNSLRFFRGSNSSLNKHRPALSIVAMFFASIVSSPLLHAQGFKDIPTDPRRGDALLDEYFQIETRKIANRSLATVKTAEDWNLQKPALRRQLFEMLGLQPLPARSKLKAEITGTIEREGIIVENIVFQSRPGLYVTANFYRPKEQDGPLPTILYVCGHGRRVIDGVSYGNKTAYQHHGTWFAKNGYTCLIIDTVQLGEIEGVHHGTYSKDRWWWNARGYTPAGVEAWAGIRALDYLETREEVDADKFGVTGRSGGGAYSWWIAALDERIKVAAPVAGITSMQNHIIDGCIEGHCDCMFMVNTYRWDFPTLAALVAPRPLMILNTDNDRIFPLDGVVDVFTKTRKIYELLGEKEKLGLAFYQGPHLDTQPLRVPAFHWFERHLKGADISDELANTTAPKIFTLEELKVLDEIPENERNTVIDDYFTKRVPRTPKMPKSASDWTAERALTLSRLKSKSFRGWPSGNPDLALSEDYRTEDHGLAFSRWSFNSQTPFRLPFFLVHNKDLKAEELDLIVLNVLDEKSWSDFLSGVGAAFPEAFPGIDLPALDESRFTDENKMHAAQKWGMAYLPPRGIGPTAWTSDKKERTHIRRRFALLGQSLDAMRVWDIRRGIHALREIEGMTEPQLWLQSSDIMAGNTLYASLFEKDIHRLDLHQLPASHRIGPTYLNILRYTDLPQTVAIAAMNSQIRIYTDKADDWKYLTQLSRVLKWDKKQVQIRKPAPANR